MVRYSLLRILIFFGFLFLFWLIGLRNNPVLLLGASAIASAAASYILLRGMRDEVTARLVERHQARLEAKQQVDRSSDEYAEDSEDELDAEDLGEAPTRAADATGAASTERPGGTARGAATERRWSQAAASRSGRRSGRQAEPGGDPARRRGRVVADTEEQ